jgi:hypothetical protein
MGRELDLDDFLSEKLSKEALGIVSPPPAFAPAVQHRIPNAAVSPPKLLSPPKARASPLRQTPSKRTPDKKRADAAEDREEETHGDYTSQLLSKEELIRHKGAVLNRDDLADLLAQGHHSPLRN